jgi:predicted  nucleic acid-binding Zn-ribbon protein
VTDTTHAKGLTLWPLQVEALYRQITAGKSELVDEQSRSAELREQNAALQRELEASQERFARVEAELVEAQSDLADMRGELGQTARELAKASAAGDDLGDRYNQVMAELQSTQAGLVDYETTVRDLKDREQDLGSKLKGLGEQLSIEEEKSRGLAGRIKELEQTVSDKNTEVARREEFLVLEREKTEGLMREAADGRTALERLKGQLDELQAAYARLAQDSTKPLSTSQEAQTVPPDVTAHETQTVDPELVHQEIQTDAPEDKPEDKPEVKPEEKPEEKQESERPLTAPEVEPTRMPAVAPGPELALEAAASDSPATPDTMLPTVVVPDLSAEVESLSAKVEALSKEKDGLSRERDGLHSDLEDFKGRYNRLEKTLKDLQDVHDELQATLRTVVKDTDLKPVPGETELLEKVKELAREEREESVIELRRRSIAIAPLGGVPTEEETKELVEEVATEAIRHSVINLAPVDGEEEVKERLQNVSEQEQREAVLSFRRQSVALAPEGVFDVPEEKAALIQSVVDEAQRLSFEEGPPAAGEGEVLKQLVELPDIEQVEAVLDYRRRSVQVAPGGTPDEQVQQELVKIVVRQARIKSVINMDPVEGEEEVRARLSSVTELEQNRAVADFRRLSLAWAPEGVFRTMEMKQRLILQVVEEALVSARRRSSPLSVRPGTSGSDTTSSGLGSKPTTPGLGALLQRRDTEVQPYSDPLNLVAAVGEVKRIVARPAVTSEASTEASSKKDQATETLVRRRISLMHPSWL